MSTISYVDMFTLYHMFFFILEREMALLHLVLNEN